MLRKFIHHLALWILRPRCPYEPPPDTPSSDEERHQFELEEARIDARLDSIRVERSIARLNRTAAQARRKRRQDG